MKPDHTALIEHHAFHADTPFLALDKLADWFRENQHEVDIINSRVRIDLSYCDETNAYTASIDGDYRNGVTLEDIQLDKE